MRFSNIKRLTVKQLDIIIWVCVGALIVTFIKIFMDAGIL